MSSKNKPKPQDKPAEQTSTGGQKSGLKTFEDGMKAVVAHAQSKGWIPR